MTLVQRIQARVRPHLSSRSRILCAVSGGPDSLVLAHLLKQAGFPLAIGHVDHQLRKTSRLDAIFVKETAKRWGVPYYQAKVPVSTYAKTHRLGIEEAGRVLRYRALRGMAKKGGCVLIATAHTADDQAETVLMNFLRGAGPSGLAGIPPLRALTPGLSVLRPLLDTSKQEVLDYAAAQSLAFRTDPSNRSSKFTRNRIRHYLLPLLEKDHPGLRRRLGQMGDIFREEQDLWSKNLQPELNKTVRQNNKNITIDLAQLLGYHRALGRRILRHLLTGITFQDIERIFQLAAAPEANLPVQLSGGLRAVRKGNELIIRSRGFHE